MGRRAIPRADIQVNAQDPEIQGKIDSISKMLLDKLEAGIKGKLDQLDAENLAGLLKQFRGLLHAIKKPSSSLAMVNLPLAPAPRPEPLPIEVRKKLRASGERYLTEKELEQSP